MTPTPQHYEAALREQQPAEKVASIYKKAAHNIEVEKVAESYGVEDLPGHYKEALYKEAIIQAFGAKVLKGIGHLGQKLVASGGQAAAKAPGAGARRMNVGGRLSNFANHPTMRRAGAEKIVGGLAAGGAGLAAASGATGFAAGRVSKQ